MVQITVAQTDATFGQQASTVLAQESCRDGEIEGPRDRLCPAAHNPNPINTVPPAGRHLECSYRYFDLVTLVPLHI
ncbi:hypothetical protein TgHK011_001914 [Trichoderma gracile]|nr:hypothetical protein TgHK011_001914 [Trichoderma gracile]